MRQIIKLILILFLLSSCDYEAQISYKITNRSSYEIKIIYNENGHDDTLRVDKDITELIAIHGHGLSSVDNYKETNDELSEFKRIDIYRIDTIKTVTNYIQTKNWIWQEKDAHSADYTAIVTDDDFE